MPAEPQPHGIAASRPAGTFVHHLFLSFPVPRRPEREAFREVRGHEAHPPWEVENGTNVLVCAV